MPFRNSTWFVIVRACPTIDKAAAALAQRVDCLVTRRHCNRAIATITPRVISCFMKLFNRPMRHLPLLCIFGLAPAIAYAGDTTQVYLGEGELNYVGYLDEQANQRLFSLYEGLKDKPATLAIRSRGGDVVHGMALGEWVHAHKLDVRVMEFCLSSCANYVFTAGARKIVSSNAMIGFHGGLGSKEMSIGGARKEEYDAMNAKGKAAFQAALRRERQPQLDRETAFFKRSAYARTSQPMARMHASRRLSSMAGHLRSRASGRSASIRSKLSTRPGSPGF